MKPLLLLAMLFFSQTLFARGEKDLINRQQKQERIIRAAYKRNKITRMEYDKLMREQQTIKKTIELADLDGIWSPRELNYVKGKLDRADKRLIRYKNNSEVY